MAELYLDGTWVGASTKARREIRCPADGSLVAEVDEAGPEDTERAVAAAHRAFHEGAWPTTSSQERGAILLRVADLLERDTEDIARMESLDTGKRLVESEYDVADVVSVFRHFGKVASEAAGRVVDTGNPDVVSRIVHEPVGVCGLITPWNYPLLQVSWKVAPCLAAGNTFVLKPSELTPHSAIHLMRLLEEAGLPAGVANLVLGTGAEAGAPLCRPTRGVDLVSFTGGLETGKRIMAAASDTVKRIALELGGKNPNIVFADADLEVALDYALTAVFLHSGQVCSAGARLLVEESIHDRFVGSSSSTAPSGSGSVARSTRRPRPARSPAQRTATRSRSTSRPGSPRAPYSSAAASDPTTLPLPTASTTCPRSSTGARRRCRSLRTSRSDRWSR